jgi:hypothetical protein
LKGVPKFFVPKFWPTKQAQFNAHETPSGFEKSSEFASNPAISQSWLKYMYISMNVCCVNP